MENKKINFYDLHRKKLEDLLMELEKPTFHATQLFKWVYRDGVKDFMAMSNIGKKLQEQLMEKIDFQYLKIDVVQESKDGTIKLLLSLEDNQKVESVIMPYEFGNSICVSSQVGCNMKCAFCASGLLNKFRNLTVGEMAGQVIAANNYLKEKFPQEEKRLVSNVVIMGTGEPFDNFDNVLNFINLLNDPFAFNIGIRRITVSTCGIVPRIYEFTDLGIAANLAISLHATTDKKRLDLMPINKVYPLQQLLQAIYYYQDKVKRKITIEYIMIDEVNDTLEDAKRLQQMFQHLPAQVLINLIELNNVTESAYKRSRNTQAFYNYLKKKNVNVTIRKEFGKDIDASCGQLRAKFAENNIAIYSDKNDK